MNKNKTFTISLILLFMTATNFSQPKPDLIPVHLSIEPAVTYSNVNITFKARISNIDSGNAGISFAELTVFGPGSYKVTYTIPVPAIKGKRGRRKPHSQLIEKTYTVPKPGNYTNTLELDVGNRIGESNEDNNLKMINHTVKQSLPDLVVCYYRVWYVRINSRKAGLLAYVKNIGNAPSAPCKLYTYIEKRGSKLFNIPKLAPGEQYKVFRSEYWTRRGKRRYSLIVDHGDTIDEFKEQNNRGGGIIKKRNQYYISSPLYCSGTR